MWHHLESSCRIVKLDASKIISRNFRSLRDDSTTRNILNKLPLKAYGRSKNLRDLLSEAAYLETFRTNQQVLSPVTGPFASHVTMSIHLPQGTPKGHPSITGPFFSAPRTALFIL